MNNELIKRFTDVCSELQEVGVFGIMEGRLHIKLSKLKEMENLQFKSRDGDSDYAYEIFTIVEGVRIFALATHENMKDFPQFNDSRKADLKKQLAAIEAELKEGEQHGQVS